MERIFQHGNELVRISGSRQGQTLRIETNAGVRDFEWEELGPGDYLLRAGPVQQRCVVAREGEEHWLWIDGRVHHLRTASARAGPHGAHAPGDLVAPMPGQVLQVFVRPGEHVTRQQPLVVLEAMKMRYEIVAPRDGRVAQVCVHEGAQVAGGAALVVLEEEATP